MKSLILPTAVSLLLANVLAAQTCREVVRDASGRIVQTIERQKQAGGTERAVTRDASGEDHRHRHDPTERRRQRTHRIP